MTFRKHLFTLALCAAPLFSGCGGPSDGDSDDLGTAVDECALGIDNCSPNATCTDTATAFTCACRVGFSGNGVTCEQVPCNDASDCDDSVSCTVDSCTASGGCLHTPTSSLCADNAICHPTDGCTVGRICGSPSDCVDSDPCTQDEMCNASSATCVFAPLDHDEDGEVPLVCGGTDCDDDDDGVGVDGDEICGNEVDDDCDGEIDTDATLSTDGRLRSDENNCGTCGNTCTNGDTCYQGVCVACGTRGGACCNTFCNATSCVGGTCSNGDVCASSAGTAVCEAPPPPCGARGEPCCANDVCDIGSACNAENTCDDPIVVTCSDAGAEVSYRLNVLHVPTPVEASAGGTTGHDVDNRGTICGVPDYAGQVDNSLIDLAAAFPALAPDNPVDIQGEIDTALACPAGSPSCTRLDLVVRVRPGTNCMVIEIENGIGTTLAGPFAATVDASGNFEGQTASFQLDIPFVGNESGIFEFGISGVIVTGTRSGNTLSNIVIGGYLARASFEDAIMSILPALGTGIEFEDIGPILENLYDVQIGGLCAALSVGLTASGTQLP